MRNMGSYAAMFRFHLLFYESNRKKKRSALRIKIIHKSLSLVTCFIWDFYEPEVVSFTNHFTSAIRYLY
jgi:hypothetical protein